MRQQKIPMQVNSLCNTPVWIIQNILVKLLFKFNLASLKFISNSACWTISTHDHNSLRCRIWLYCYESCIRRWWIILLLIWVTRLLSERIISTFYENQLIKIILLNDSGNSYFFLNYKVNGVQHLRYKGGTDS